MQGPAVADDHVLFRFHDGRGSLMRVRLVHALCRPREHDFERDGAGRWHLHFDRPPVDRLEYQLELTRRSGRSELVCDPENPLRAPGPFGDKSVVEFPQYREPAWVRERARPGTIRELRLARRRLPALVWTPAGIDPDAELPLLVAHDGPEYAQYSGLVHYLEVAQAAGWIPPLRAALLQPVERNEIYSASGAYTRSLTRAVLPALRTDPTTLPVGIGASLGGLALLHAQRAVPASFDGLLLQSGSFFRPRSDPQESGTGRFRRISRFVGQVLAARTWDDPIPVVVTCGTGEENLENNRAVADALGAQGYEVDFVEVRDAHTWTCWRDAFHPHLDRLLARAWT